MPLPKSGSQKSLQASFHDLRHGPQFQRTKSKFGLKKAVAQMEAAALSNQRKFLHKPHRQAGLRKPHFP